MDAEQIIKKLQMEPHPEGGYYTRTFEDERRTNGRSVGTAIYYLLKAGEISRWHRVDAAEIWHFYSGAPLELRIATDGDTIPETLTLGIDLMAGQRPQGIVKTGYWQSARSLGDWTLVGCTVSPGFEFAGFEMAEDGWEPGG